MTALPGSVPPTPALRRVATQILSPLGWMQATLHVPLEIPLLDFLANPNPVIALTHVRLPKEPDPVPFLAVDRDALIVVAPAFAQELLETAGRFGRTVARDVACFLPGGILRARLEVPLNLRLSDHLRQAGEFLVLQHGMFTPYGETLQSPESRGLQAIVLRRSHAVGIAEWS